MKKNYMLFLAFFMIFSIDIMAGRLLISKRSIQEILPEEFNQAILNNELDLKECSKKEWENFIMQCCPLTVNNVVAQFKLAQDIESEVLQDRILGRITENFVPTTLGKKLIKELSLSSFRLLKEKLKRYWSEYEFTEHLINNMLTVHWKK
ncbi:MAG: hypothetical protein WDZ41_00950 [Candidatus Babeliales bacterium]